MTEHQAINQAEEFNKHICEICCKPIEPADLAEFPMQDGEDSFSVEPCHTWCLAEREEVMYRSSCINPDEAFI